jgi:hypothetical protein
MNDEEGGGWTDGEGWLPRLAGLREEIIRGDLRVLYLAWLVMVYADEEAYEDEPKELKRLEPPVPANLKKLSPAQEVFCDFFGIDGDLVTAAAAGSPKMDRPAEPDVESLVARLSEKERTAFLVRLAKGDPAVAPQLSRRLQELSRADKPAEEGFSRPRRTLGELLALTKEKEKQRKETDRKKAEKKKAKKMKELSGKEPELWKEAVDLIGQKKTNAYDQAVDLLKDLRELADYQEKTEEFLEQLNSLLKRYSTLSGLKYRVTAAKLLEKDFGKKESAWD